MTNKLRSITVAIGLVTSILFLSYLLTLNLQPSLYFVQAQNSSTEMAQNDTRIFISSTCERIGLSETRTVK